MLEDTVGTGKKKMDLLKGMLMVLAIFLWFFCYFIF